MGEQFRWDELAETEEVIDAGNLLQGRVRVWKLRAVEGQGRVTTGQVKGIGNWE
jgi:hypothetical protein